MEINLKIIEKQCRITPNGAKYSFRLYNDEMDFMLYVDSDTWSSYKVSEFVYVKLVKHD